MKRLKVLVAMSVGVDSSVAALLIKKKGYEVVGGFMKNWSDTKNKITGECAWKEERRFALKIAKILEIPLVTLDFEKEYKEQVIDKMFDSYKKGKTPNPDIECNRKIKFPLFLKYAKRKGFDKIVTGHYSRIKKSKGIYRMFRAKDKMKDQSYFLYGLSQKELKDTLFPIGDYTKKQVREIARKEGFPNYNKKGTVGICFVGKINLKDFLQKRIKPKMGDILDSNGKKIGKHDGIYYYTIGQRIGPRYGINIKKTKEEMKRWYVVGKNAKKNTLTVASEGNPLNFRKEFFIKNFHSIEGDEKNFLNKIKNHRRKFLSRIRSVGELLKTRLSFEEDKKILKAVLKNAISGISEGQAVVLYKGKRVIGGGEIYF